MRRELRCCFATGSLAVSASIFYISKIYQFAVCKRVVGDVADIFNAMSQIHENGGDDILMFIQAASHLQQPASSMAPIGLPPVRAADFLPAPCPWAGCVLGSRRLETGLVATDAQTKLDSPLTRKSAQEHLNRLLAEALDGVEETMSTSTKVHQRRFGQEIPRTVCLERMAAAVGWRLCVPCEKIRKPGTGRQPQDRLERSQRLQCEPGLLCRPTEDPDVVLSVREARVLRSAAKASAAAEAREALSAPSPTLLPSRARPTLIEMASAGGFKRKAVFGSIPRGSLGPHSRVGVRLPRNVAVAERKHGSDSLQFQHANQDLELLTVAVARCLYRGEDGYGMQ